MGWEVKVSWVKYFLGLDSDDEIIKALTNLGSMELEDSTDVTEGLPTVLKLSPYSGLWGQFYDSQYNRSSLEAIPHEEFGRRKSTTHSPCSLPTLLTS